MHNKDKIKTILIVILVIAFLGICYIGDNKSGDIKLANTAYKVYLNGESLGLIKDSNELYNLINREQEAIKNEYEVDNVYPPNGFYLAEVTTYDANYSSVENVYNTIALKDDFTIKGYIVTIKSNDETKDTIKISVLDKEIFEKAIRKFVLAFISEEDYNKYINNEFGELAGIGQIIQSMKFDENISIKEGFISVKDHIYTDVDDLSQYLLFGPNAKMDSYTIKSGDDIESVSDKYKLNPEEFVIANPEYRGSNVLLKVGDKVNVTLLNPVLTFRYSVYQIEENETPFLKRQVIDSTKDASYSEITQVGVTGLSLVKETYEVINGEQSTEVKFIGEPEVIRTAVDQITTIGKKYSAVRGEYEETDGDWGYPTLVPFHISSRFGYRWGKLHAGLDITGTGEGSPIFAIADGVVTQVVPYCKSCLRWTNGNYVVIKHYNGYYSAYLHLRGFNCQVGQEVRKGDVIGYMGQTGFATGTHLHLGLFKVEPYVGQGYEPLDPYKVIFAQIKKK